MQSTRTKKESSAVVASAITAVAQLNKPAVASSTQQTPTTQATAARPATTVAQTQAPATSEAPTTHICI